MARIRTIKPEFPQSESIGRLSRDARLLFIMLWTIADDSGRARASSRMLASLLFPYDDDAVKLIPEWLEELEREHCVIVYAIDGNSYLQIEKWGQHQKIDHPSPSRLPQVPSKAKTRENVRKPREKIASASESFAPYLVPSTLDLGEDLGPSISAVPALKHLPKKLLNGHQKEFDEFWLAYPKKVAKGAAAKAFLKALSRADASVILDGAKGYARSRNGEDAQFTKAPATWLNADCWLDEAPITEGNGPDPDMAAALEAEREHRRKHGEIE